MQLVCTECDGFLYYTGEHHPTRTPQRYYACQNFHMFLVYGQPEEEVEWGTREMNRLWRRSVINQEIKINWTMIGKLHWKSSH